MATANKKGRAAMIIGGILSLAGFLFGISPFIVMYVQGLGGNPPANEAEPGGAVGWLLFLTIPLGGFACLIGLIVLLVGLALNLSKK